MIKKLLLYIVIFIFIAGLLIIISNIFFDKPKLLNSDPKFEFSTPSTEINQATQSLSNATMSIGKRQLHIEVADTLAKQAQGLSDRVELGSDGMLFRFAQPGQPIFWMKNMQFDLDFIWISQGKVVEVTKNVPKPAAGTPDDQLPRYSPAVPVDAMLEVNAGNADRWGIAVGDSVSWENSL